VSILQKPMRASAVNGRQVLRNFAPLERTRPLLMTIVCIPKASNGVPRVEKGGYSLGKQTLIGDGFSVSTSMD
jgi:hypothetical protein